MTDSLSREELLDTYGRFYGDERFAVAFTAAIEGTNAKRVTTRGWDKTLPLANADHGAGMITTSGKTKNVAIVLRPSNLIVLECDTEEDLVRIDELELPATITVRSSKPYKRHYWFRPPADMISMPYVAFRFESGKLTADSGRYFLAPPSVHPSGAIYAFLPDHGPGEMDIAELPDHVYRDLATQAQRESSDQRERIHIDPNAKVQAGNRADSIFRYASMLRRWGLSRDQIVQQALEWNEDRCEPPIERARVEMQVDGAMKMRGDQELERAHAHPLPDDDPGPDTSEPEAEATVDSWAPLNLAALEDRPPIKPTLGQAGIAYPGKRHVFSGPQESAKTLAAYAIGIEVIRTGKPIVVIDFEMGRWDARDRLRELGATDDDLALLHYVEPEEEATSQHITRLLALKPVLVIIDAAAGAYDLQGLDDNKRQDVERFTRVYVRDFWRNDIATIVLDHVVKNTEGRGKYAIGSERKVGGADVHLGFEVISPIKRGATGIYKITTHKDRGGFLERGRLADLHLHSDPATHHITWEFRASDPDEAKVEHRPTFQMERVSRYLEGQAEPVSRTNVETSVKGKNVKALRHAIDILTREQYLEETPGPRGARNVASIRPYREENDTTPTPRPTPSPPRPDGVTSPRPTESPPTGTRTGWTHTSDPDPVQEIDAQDQALIDHYASLDPGADE